MTDQLSLDELLKLGNKVKEWKISRIREGLRYEGNYEGIDFRTDLAPSNWMEHFVYKISARLEKTELGKYERDTYEENKSNTEIEAFFHSVKIKHEMVARGCAWEILKIDAKTSVDNIINLGKKCDKWYESWKRGADREYTGIFMGALQGVAFKIGYRDDYYSVRTEIDTVTIVGHRCNNGAVEKFYDFVKKENEKLIQKTEEHRRATLKMVRELAQ